MPRNHSPQDEAPTADGAGRPLEGLFFLWLDDNQRPWAMGRITRHMAYDRCMVTYYDAITLEPGWMGSMVVTGESIVLRKWLLFQTKEELLRAITTVTANAALPVVQP